MNTPARTPFWQVAAVGLLGFGGAAYVAHQFLWRQDALARQERLEPPPPVATAERAAPLSVPNPEIPKEFPLTTHQVGTRLDYKIQIESARLGKKQTVESWVVAAISSERMKWMVNGEQTGESSINPFVPMLETGKVLGREDITRAITGDPMTIFPLAVGKSFRLDVSGQNAAQQSGNYDYRCFVAAFLKAKTKFGNLDVVEVKCTAAGATVNYSARYLYAPSLGANIFYERKPARSGGYAMLRELVEIQKPAL